VNLALAPGDYQWKVIADNGCDNGCDGGQIESESRSFTIR